MSRHIQNTTDESLAASTQTSVALFIDHECLRNMLLHGSAAYNIAEYRSGGGSQTLYTAGAGVTYLANRYARVSARYDSSPANPASTAVRGCLARPLAATTTTTAGCFSSGSAGDAGRHHT